MNLPIDAALLVLGVLVLAVPPPPGDHDEETS